MERLKNTYHFCNNETSSFVGEQGYGVLIQTEVEFGVLLQL
jgi:hypothetical protein